MISAATSSRVAARRAATVAFVLAAVLSACGKKGPPSPPLRVTPAAPGAFSARQVGLDVVLAATVSGRRTDGTPLGDGTAVQILRMVASPSLRPGAVSERYLVQQFLKQSRPVAAVSGADLAAQVSSGRLQFIDRGAASMQEPAAGLTGGPAYLYGMQVVEPGGGRSPMRPPVFVELAAPPPPPGALQAETAEGEVRLRWEAPSSGAGTYNVYRKVQESTREPDIPINPAPLQAPDYTDRAFAYDTGYVYFVRTVALDRRTPCESVAGPPAEVQPHDRFAPAAPTGIAVAVEGGQIRLYWFPSAESDLAGYRIYRRAEGESEARGVGEVAAGESSFADASAVAGVRYHYAVSAIDTAAPPNESPRSEERTERLAPADQRGGTPDGGDGGRD